MLKAVELSDVTKLPPSAQNLQLLACQHASPPEALQEPKSKGGCLNCLCPAKPARPKKKRSSEVMIHLADHQHQLHSVLLPAISSSRTAKISSSPVSKHGGFASAVTQKPPWPDQWLEASSVPEALREELHTGRAKSITVHSSYVPPGGVAEAKVVSAHWSDLSPGWLLLVAKSVCRGAPAGTAPKWRWQALHISPEMDAVSTTHDTLHDVEPSEQGAVMTSVLMHHNPTGGQLAIGVTGPAFRSCIITLDRDLDLMWHAPWQSFHRDGSLCSLAWLYDTEYVAAVDNTGHMRVFHEQGGMALLELPEHVAKAGLAQPSRPHIQCNKLLGDQDSYPGQLQHLMQNRQPRPQAAYQLCTPAGASYSSLTSNWMACLDGAAPEVPFLAQSTTPTPSTANPSARNNSKNSKSSKGNSSSSSRELLLLVISNCQVVMALTFHLSGTPPSPSPPSHPSSKPRGVQPPSSGLPQQQDGTEHNKDAHHSQHDTENGDADIASFTHSSLNPLYSKRSPGEAPQLTQQQQQQQQQQQGTGAPGTEGELAVKAGMGGGSEMAIGGLPAVDYQAAPLDLNSADVGGLSPQEREALLLGVPQVPLGSSLLAYAASKRQQQQQQQQQGHVQHQGVHPASIQWHRLADHWQQLCASLPDSAVPQSEPALPPAPLSPVGSPSALTTKAAYQDPAHRSFLLPNWPSPGTVEPSSLSMHTLSSVAQSGGEALDGIKLRRSTDLTSSTYKPSRQSLPLPTQAPPHHQDQQQQSHQQAIHDHQQQHHQKAQSSLTQLGSSRPWGSDVFVLDSRVLEALLAGDAALLNGRPLQGLRHYARAHMFGFLPCLLVLLRCGQLGPSLHLLSRFARMVAKHSTQGSLSTPKDAKPAQQQHSTEAPDLEGRRVTTYSELASEWEAQARACLQPFLEGEESAPGSGGHGSGDAQQLMHAARQQVGVACQCLAYISCALQQQQQQQQQEGGRHGAGSTPVASQYSPPQGSMGVISLPTPVVWHPLVPVHFMSTQNTPAPAATEAAVPSGGAQPSHVCCFKLFHAAFDVRVLQHGLQSRCTAAAPAVLGKAAQFTPGAAAPQAAPSQQNAHTAAASVAAAFSDPRYAVGLLAVAHACEVEVQKHLLLHGHPLAQTHAHPHPCAPSSPINARVNWQLLHQYPSAARMAAVWREVGDWRKAVVLAFSVHQLMQRQPRMVRRIASGHQLATPSTPRSAGAVSPSAKHADGLAGGGSAGDGSPADAAGTEAKMIGCSSGSSSDVGCGDEEDGSHTLQSKISSPNGPAHGEGTCLRPPPLQLPTQPTSMDAGSRTGSRQATPKGYTNKHSRSRSDGGPGSMSQWSGTRLQHAMAAGRAGRPAVPPPGSCLQIGWAIIEAQMAPDMLAGLEVNAACQTLHELLHIPRHLLGPASPVSTQLLREVCQRLASLLPKRLCISPLSPLCSASTPPKDGISLVSLLDLSNDSICRELHAHLAASATAALQAACQTHCRGVASSHVDTKGSSDGEGRARAVVAVLQSLFEDVEVEACLKMLLQWRGASLETQAFEAAIKQVCTCAKRACNDNAAGYDLRPLEVLPLLQHALIQTPALLPEDDMHAVLQHMQALLGVKASGGPHLGDAKESVWGSGCGEGDARSGGSGEGEMGGVDGGRRRRRMGEELGPQNGKVPVLPPIERNQGVARRQAREQEECVELPVRDAGELSMLVDCARIMGTLLSCLCPLLPESFPQVYALVQHAAVKARGNSSSSTEGEQELMEGTEVAAANADGPESDGSGFDGALQGHLVTLLSVDWALVTRSHVAALLHALLTQRGLAEARPAHGAAAVQAHALEKMLLHWMVALVEGAAFHPQAELQALVHGVLSAVGGHALPIALVASVDAALRQRRVLNARLAEEVARLKRAAAAAAQETSLSDTTAQAERRHAPDREELVTVGCVTVVAPAQAQEQWQDAIVSTLWQLAAHEKGSANAEAQEAAPAAPAPAAAPAADEGARDGPLAATSSKGTAGAADCRGSLLLCVLSSMVGRPWFLAQPSRSGPHALSEELGSCFANPLLPIPLPISPQSPPPTPDQGHAVPSRGPHTPTEASTPLQQLEGLMRMGMWGLMGANNAGAAEWEAAVAAAYDAWTGAPAAEALIQSDPDTDRGAEAAQNEDGAEHESKGMQEIEPEDEGVAIVGGPGVPHASPPTDAELSQQQQHGASGSGVEARRSLENESKADEASAAAKLADFWWEEGGSGAAAAPGGAVPGGPAPRSAVPMEAMPKRPVLQQQQQQQDTGIPGGLDGITQRSPEESAVQTSRDEEHGPRDSAAGMAAAGGGGAGGDGGILTPSSSSFSSASADPGTAAGPNKVPSIQVAGSKTKGADVLAQAPSEGHPLAQQQQQDLWQQRQQLELEAAFARDGQKGLASACAHAMGYAWPQVQEGQDAEGAAGAAHPQQRTGPSMEMGAAAVAKALGYDKYDAQSQGPLLTNGQDSAAALEYAHRTGAGRVEAFLYSVGISPAGSRAGSSYPPSTALTSPASSSKPGYPTTFSNSVPAPAYHIQPQGTSSPQANSSSATSKPTSHLHHHTPPPAHTTLPGAGAHPQHENVPSPARHRTPAHVDVPYPAGPHAPAHVDVPSPAAHHTPAQVDVPSSAGHHAQASSGTPAASGKEQRPEGASNPGLAVPTSLNHLDHFLSVPHSPSLESVNSSNRGEQEGVLGLKEGMVEPKEEVVEQTAKPPLTPKQSHSAVEHPPIASPPALPKTNSGRVQHQSVLVTHPHPHLRTALSISRPESPPRNALGTSNCDSRSTTGGGGGGGGGAGHPWGRVALDTRDVLTGRQPARAPLQRHTSPSTAVVGHAGANHTGYARKQHSLLEQSLGEMLWRGGGEAEVAPRYSINGSPTPQGAHKAGMLASSIGNALGTRQVGIPGAPDARATMHVDGVRPFGDAGDGSGCGKEPNGALASGVNDTLLGKEFLRTGADARDAAAADGDHAVPSGVQVTAAGAGRSKLSSSIEDSLRQSGQQQQQQEQEYQMDLPEGLGNGVEVMENVLYDEEREGRSRNNPCVFQNDVFEAESDFQSGTYALKQHTGPQERNGGESFSSGGSSASGNPLFDPGSQFVSAKQAVC